MKKQEKILTLKKLQITNLSSISGGFDDDTPQRSRAGHICPKWTTISEEIEG